MRRAIRAGLAVGVSFYMSVAGAWVGPWLAGAQMEAPSAHRCWRGTQLRAPVPSGANRLAAWCPRPPPIPAVFGYLGFGNEVAGDIYSEFHTPKCAGGERPLQGGGGQAGGVGARSEVARETSGHEPLPPMRPLSPCVHRLPQGPADRVQCAHRSPHGGGLRARGGAQGGAGVCGSRVQERLPPQTASCSICPLHHNLALRSPLQNVFAQALFLTLEEQVGGWLGVPRNAEAIAARAAEAVVAQEHAALAERRASRLASLPLAGPGSATAAAGDAGAKGGADGDPSKVFEPEGKADSTGADAGAADDNSSAGGASGAPELDDEAELQRVRREVLAGVSWTTDGGDQRVGSFAGPYRVDAEVRHWRRHPWAGRLVSLGVRTLYVVLTTVVGICCPFFNQASLQGLPVPVGGCMLRCAACAACHLAPHATKTLASHCCRAPTRADHRPGGLDRVLAAGCLLPAGDVRAG